MSNHIWFSERLSKMVLHISLGNVGNGRHSLFPQETAILRSFHNFAQWLNLALLPTKQPTYFGQCIDPNPNKHLCFNCTESIVKVITKITDFTNTGNTTHQLASLAKSLLVYNAYLQWQSSRLMPWLLVLPSH